MDKDYFNMGAYGVPPYYGFDSVNADSNSAPMDNGGMFNPLMQYEQAYMYYRYLSQQMEYKIKCKEYEKLSANTDNSRTSSRKIE